jgi:DNA-binding response OmpR family regulator
MKPTRVLAIVNDPADRAGYESAFDVDGFRLRTADSPGSGFAALQIFRPDAVILDVSMPVKSGLPWLSAVRGLPGFEHLPIVVVTDGRSAPIAASRFGIHAALNKKRWTPRSLVAVVRRAVKRPQLPALDRAA